MWVSSEVVFKEKFVDIKQRNKDWKRMISKTGRFHWTHKFYEKRELIKIRNQWYRKWTYNREQQVWKFFVVKDKLNL